MSRVFSAILIVLFSSVGSAKTKTEAKETNSEMESTEPDQSTSAEPTKTESTETNAENESTEPSQNNSAEPGQTESANVRQAEALRRDLLSIVAIAEQQVWNIDRYEIEGLLNKALVCVCRTTPTVRQAALRLLAADIERLGGPIEEAWQKANKDLSDISELVTYDRTAKLLERSVKESATDCPFHIEPETPYEEQNRAPERFFLSTEGGGLLNTRFMQDEVFAGGGGSGRIMVGYGLSPDWSIRVGAEMGGAGLVDKSLATEDLNLDFYSAIPLVFRHRNVVWHQDVEVAGVAFGAPWNGMPRFAARIGGLVGLTYTRIGLVQPWGGLKLSAEYAPESGADPAMTTIRIGFRFGVNFHI